MRNSSIKYTIVNPKKIRNKRFFPRVIDKRKSMPVSLMISICVLKARNVLIEKLMQWQITSIYITIVVVPNPEPKMFKALSSIYTIITIIIK
jgi:hypothetical protein